MRARSDRPTSMLNKPRASLNLTATGTSVSYLDTVHHRASLEGLAPGTRFFYRCGNPDPNPSDADGEVTAAGAGAGLPSLDVTVVGEGARTRRGGGEEGGDGESAGGAGLGLNSQGPSSSDEAAPGVRGARGGGGRGGGAMEVRDAGKWSSVFSFETAPEAERWGGVVW